ncbi:fungal-specific transcription factor domain-containing protein [Rhodocollybia butyracea]|uniref:Fungal-specific transcription factor domain-containing protein n=1 Tax=Rhodocollybia butyracea TaxID=206335 RepID=A0A9P5PXL6_9AGAR|nr:fungal-specific transcription factor domain-containing protein [Rhodocollybia butyracea]
MSDNDNTEDISRSGYRSTGGTPAVKQRRFQHACDACKKRKIRCDSAAKAGGPCSHCISMEIECRHTLPRKKRGPVAGRSSRLKSTNIQALTTSILSSVPYVIPKDESELRQIFKELASYIRTLETELAGSVSKVESQVGEGLPSSSEEDEEDELSEQLEQFRFAYSHGRHNGVPRISLIKAGIHDNKADKAAFEVFKRPLYWDLQPWQITTKPQLEPLIFPPQDLLADLLNIWWEKVHYIFPLLHRPTFEKSIAAGLHYHDRHFGETVLAVCALASRHSDDARIFSHGSQLSAGFRWMQQVHPVPMSFLEPPSVSEVQKLVIYIMFMQTTTMPHSGWVICGIGMRMLQDVGAHRKKSGPPTVLGELWKRAFWFVNYIDISMSMIVGRPRAISSDDYDTEFPVECDDEYWEQPGDLAFKQPSGKHCKVSYWIHTLKLLHVLEQVQRAMRFVRRSSKAAQGVLLAGRQRAITEIDKSLTEWLETIPEELKWDPQRSDPVLFHQSTLLYLMYYFLRMETYRASISSPASLEVCVSTAHSCVLILEAHRKRDSYLLGPQPSATIANAAIILLINMWRGRRLKLDVDIGVEMGYVVKCLDFLARIEHQVQLAGRLRDTVVNVIFISDLTDAYSAAREHSVTELSAQPPVPGTQSAKYFITPSFTPHSSLGSFHQDGDIQSGILQQDEFNFLIPSTSDYTSPGSSLSFGAGIALASSQYVEGPQHELGSVGRQPWTSTEMSDAMDVHEGDWDRYMQSVDEILSALRQN